jgi:tetratricopeptide (TPR) repeat protein
MAATAHFNLGQSGQSEHFAEAAALLERIEPQRDQLAPLDRYHLDLVSAECRGDRLAALRAARKAAEMAPHSQWTFRYGVMALMVNRPREGNAAMATLDPDRGFLRSWLPYYYHFTSSFHLMGDHEGELRQAREARRRFPQSLGAHAIEARALAALGREDEVVALLEQAVTLATEFVETPGRVILLAERELLAHGYPEKVEALAEWSVLWHERLSESERRKTMNRANLARVLFDAGDLERSKAIYEGLSAETPDSIEYRGSIGVLAARLGDADAASDADRWLTRQDRPFLFGEVLYWRAAIAAWSGQTAEAVPLLRQAYGQGRTFYWNAHELPHLDPMLRPLWREPEFVELIRPKG